MFRRDEFNALVRILKRGVVAEKSLAFPAQFQPSADVVQSITQPPPSLPQSTPRRTHPSGHPPAHVAPRAPRRITPTPVDTSTGSPVRGNLLDGVHSVMPGRVIRLHNRPTTTGPGPRPMESPPRAQVRHGDHGGLRIADPPPTNHTRWLAARRRHRAAADARRSLRHFERYLAAINEVAADVGRMVRAIEDDSQLDDEDGAPVMLDFDDETEEEDNSE